MLLVPKGKLSVCYTFFDLVDGPQEPKKKKKKGREMETGQLKQTDKSMNDIKILYIIY